MDIDPAEGFTPQRDIFGRADFGARLTRIVPALENPSVLLLDAPWGTGKTTFVKMWQGQLAQAKIPSIYFDAFANDYQEDAFLAVASQIIAQAENVKPRKGEAIKTFKKEALRTAKILGRASLRFAVRAATAGVIESEDLKKAAAEVAKDFGDEATKAIDDLLKERLESHDSDRKIFDSFKEALGELALELSSPHKSESNDLDREFSEAERLPPLVFIIDELDRCRPSFALEILEKVKHLFSVNGVVFVLVSSLKQLETAVCFAYGDIDAHTYLEKFYQLRILFPVGRQGRPDMATATYLRYLGCNENIADVIDEASSIYPLSLRTIERIVAYSKLIQISVGQKGLFVPQIIAILCMLKVLKPDVYDRARKSQLSFEQLDEVFHFSAWRNSRNSQERTHLSERVENWWLFALGVMNDKRNEMQFQQMLWSYNIEPPRIIPYFCDLMDGFAFPGGP
jgi:hypothetical protein